MPRRPRVLIAESIRELRPVLSRSLSGSGFEVKCLQDTGDRLNEVSSFTPDVLLLDAALLGPDGDPFVHKIRESSKAPIIVSSIVDTSQARAAAFEAGALEFLPKPFDIGRLVAKIEAALAGLNGVVVDWRFRCDALEIDLAEGRVFIDGRPVDVNIVEMQLLKRLAQDACRVVSYRQLLIDVWGPTYEDEMQYLRSLIGRLRKKLGDAGPRPRYILTEPGAGYRLRSPTAPVLWA
jgi:two-component system KDP operon response regulator KdpE